MGQDDPQDQKRFEQEALPHLDALSTAAMHLMRNRDEADDLCQETMLRAFASSISSVRELTAGPGC
jgi:DNA-directed RNA polymerase specialized sigma24 family protein